MRTRETHINIRTTPKEKSAFERNAKKCGLSLSEYLRKLANGYEPKTLPPLEYQKIYSLLTDVYVDWMSSGDSVSANYLLSVVKEMQSALNPSKGGGKLGDHENLGD
jgi:hypothetical protein